MISFARAGEIAIERSQARRRGVEQHAPPYGIPAIDRMTRGLKPGELVIAAGRPGMGKSSFGVSLALNVVRRGFAAYYVSLEMTAEELGQRALAALCYRPGTDAITYHAIAAGKALSDAQFERLVVAQQEFKDLPLTLDEQPGLTFAQIAARARRAKAAADRAGRPLRVLVIDHIGLIAPSSRYAGNRVQELAEISAGLKSLAKDLGVAVVALSQLSRGIEGRSDKRPSLADLRDSGALEQDADTVLGLYRKAYYMERRTDLSEDEINEMLDSQREIEIEVLKNRHGPTGRVKLFCAIACNVIAEVAA